ncbi:MAG: hypothetical protein U9R53_05020, partial [Chloroflexota bacterium]|nr:hypothetical protein [Chloroflexota bacterium]
QNLIDQEAPKYSSQKTLKKAVRRKLHNIVAPYLGDPDYEQLLMRLSQIEDSSLDSPHLQSFCLDVLNLHASTAERITHRSDFYNKLFNLTGKPNTILDLACGLHPLAFPWMGLPLTTRYHAFDIIQPRIDFINSFFIKIGLDPLAKNQDILTQPPKIHANLGIFFKEAHRFEKRNHGSNKGFFSSLNVDLLAVSLPNQDLAGTHNLLDQNRNLIYENLPTNKNVSELLIENEIIFLIEKPGQ